MCLMLEEKTVLYMCNNVIIEKKSAKRCRRYIRENRIQNMVKIEKYGNIL